MVTHSYEGLPVFLVEQKGVAGKKKPCKLQRNLLKQVNELAPLASDAVGSGVAPASPVASPILPAPILNTEPPQTPKSL